MTTQASGTDGETPACFHRFEPSRSVIVARWLVSRGTRVARCRSLPLGVVVVKTGEAYRPRGAQPQGRASCSDRVRTVSSDRAKSGSVFTGETARCSTASASPASRSPRWTRLRCAITRLTIRNYASPRVAARSRRGGDRVGPCRTARSATVVGGGENGSPHARPPEQHPTQSPLGYRRDALGQRAVSGKYRRRQRTARETWTARWPTSPG